MNQIELALCDLARLGIGEPHGYPFRLPEAMRRDCLVNNAVDEVSRAVDSAHRSGILQIEVCEGSFRPYRGSVDRFQQLWIRLPRH
jgi:hypothetical protein